MSTVPFSRTNRAPLPPDIAKKLPANLDAERSVLGAILLDDRIPNIALKTASMEVKPEDFSLEQHRRIFRNMLFLDQSDQPITMVFLLDNLERNGELEAAGGAGYLGSLGDGVPRVSNVTHYARLVKKRARQRDLIYFTQKIQMDAFESESTDDLYNELEKFSRQAASPSENPMVVVGCHELLTLDMPQPEFIVDPLLSVGGSMMIYSWAGVGKSFFTTELAAHVAMGLQKFFVWPVTRAYRVLYLYGEMHGGEIRKRWKEIAAGHKMEVPEDDQLGFVSKEFQRIKRAPRHAYDWRPSIASPTDRHIVEDWVARGYHLLVLDNVSTLWPASQERVSDREAFLKDWFMDLNQNGTSVISLTHSGKGGDFLGDSSQIHILDSVLKLRRPGDYRREEQLRAEVKIEKLRHECKDFRLLQEFEVSLTTDSDMGATWLTRPIRDTQMKSCFEMFADGMKPGEVYQDLGIARRTAYRYFDKWKKNADPKHWPETE
jgi:hypothetical protein